MKTTQIQILKKRSLGVLTALLALGCLASGTAMLVAQENTNPAAKPTKIIRELFVPFDDLNVLLRGGTQRVYLTREEYEKLIEEARQQPVVIPPAKILLTDAQYSGAIEEGRAVLQGSLTLDVLESGLQRISLPFAGVGIHEALLDGKSATISPDESGLAALYVEGVGKHTLQLQLTMPLATAAAQQSLSFQLPTVAANRFTLSVPGNVEVKSGALVVQRNIDAAKNETTFDLLLPTEGAQNIVMSLNNKLLRAQSVAVSRAVQIDEVTETYERLHATVSVAVLHGGIDHLTLTVPKDFEVTEVTSPLISNWVVKTEGEARSLQLNLREPITQSITVNIAAVLSRQDPERLKNWTFPSFDVLDMAGRVSVVGLLAEDRLRVEGLQASNLLSIDTDVLIDALPPSILQAEPGAPKVRPVVAFYGPQSTFSLTANFQRPQIELDVVASLLMTLSDERHRLAAGFDITPQAEKLAVVSVNLPADWHAESIKDAQNQDIPFDETLTSESRQLRLRLPQAAAPGSKVSLVINAISVPTSWQGDWEQQTVRFPVVKVDQAARFEGMIAVAVQDDLIARPGTLEGLTSLVEAELAASIFASAGAARGYRIDRPDYLAEFAVQRQLPTIVANSYSFFRLSPDDLHSYFEIVYDVQNARTTKLTFSLPESAPQGITLRPMDNLAIKESLNEVVDGRRVWTVLLAQGLRGRARLSVEFDEPLKLDDKRETSLHPIRAERVEYQSGKFAVEGNPELDVEILSRQRRVDIGELTDADYLPGPRLLGSYEFLGAEGDARIRVEKRAAHPLPMTLIQRSELVSQLDTVGNCQTVGRYRIRGREPFIQILLPEGAELWAAQLDGTPVKPQREKDRLLVSIPAGDSRQNRDLHILYRQKIDSMGFSGDLDLVAPKLMVKETAGSEPEEIPQTDLVWYLHLPTSYRLMKSTGSVYTEETEDDWTVTEKTAAAGYLVAGGVQPFAGVRLAMPESSQYKTASSGRDYSAKSAKKSAATQNGSKEHSRAQGSARGPSEGGIAWDSRESDQQRDSDFEINRPGGGAMGGFEGNGMGGGGMGGAGAGGMGGGGGGMGGGGMGGPGAGGMGGGSGGMPGGMRGMAGSKGDFGGDRAKSQIEDSPEPLAEKAAKSDDVFHVDSSPRVDPLDKSAETFRNGEVFDDQEEIAADGEDLADSLSRGESEADGLQDNRAYWALQGLRSLPVEFDPVGTRVSFRSLGVDPRLTGTLIHGRRLLALAIGLGLIVAVYGLSRIRHGIKSQVRFIVVTLLVASTLPLISGWDRLYGMLFDAVFYAGAAMIPCYLIARLLASYKTEIAAMIQRRWPAAAAIRTAGGLLLAAMLFNGVASAQEESPNAPEAADGSAAAGGSIADPGPAVSTPDDAVVIPYDPAKDLEPTKTAEKMLVPYDQYVELWNLAHPDKRIEPPPIAPYSLAGVKYDSTLLEGENLTISGTIELTLFADHVVTVPLALENAVLAKAVLDGQPARLVSVVPGLPPGQGANAPPADPSGLIALQVSGKGQHKLELELRSRVTKRGGWRIVAARIPSAIAANLRLVAPLPQTEIRLPNVNDRQAHETSQANQTIDTSLASDGTLSLEWRPKIAEGIVDRSLTVDSKILFDVREDGLRVSWMPQLSFRRGQYESFTLLVPGDMLVEHVHGTNVRGWEVKPDGTAQRLEVQLLGAAKGTESLQIALSLRTPTGTMQGGTVPVPVLLVEGAQLQQGTILIRRSPLIEVISANTSGLARTEVAAEMANMPSGADTTDDSPLGLRPFQAFRYVTTPYRMEITSKPTENEATAEVRTLFKADPRESLVETEVLVSPRGRPIHRLQIKLPIDVRLDDVQAPAPFEWVSKTEGDQQIVSIYFARGLVSDFQAMLIGTYRKSAQDNKLPLLGIDVLDVKRQSGVIVAQADPAYEARLEGLENCQHQLLSDVWHWLRPEQRVAARVAVAYSAPNYSGTLVLSAKTARVTCDTVTNVRLTDRAIEETILLDFTIYEAGIKEVVFQLPEWLRDAQIHAPMLSQKVVEEVTPEPPAGSPRNVRFRLILQDEVMGQLRVLISHDRLLKSAAQNFPFPLVETGSTVYRYATLENVGRDEVLTEDLVNLEPVGRQQKVFEKLSQLVGPNVTQAFVNSTADAVPSLSYKSQVREAVVTTAARIGLAETVFVLDANGTYRAQQTYQVDNKTEQFLDLELPAGSTLWTAMVVGEPVKVARPTDGSETHVRIPLVKNSEGDLDYQVVVKYGGKLDPLGLVGNTSLPFIHTKNINVEVSLVRLFLPESHEWLGFGGTMRRLSDKAEYLSENLTYQAGQIRQLSDVLQSKSVFSKARASTNLGVLGGKLDELATTYTDSNQNQEVAAKLRAGRQALQDAQSQAQEEEKQVLESEDDNRKSLTQRFSEQRGTRSKNVVRGLGANKEQMQQPMQSQGTLFSRGWLQGNNLSLNPQAQQEAQAVGGGGRVSIRERAQMRRGEGQGQAGKPLAPTNEALNKQLQEQIQSQEPNREPSRDDVNQSAGDSSKDVGRRYQQKLQQNRGDTKINADSKEQETPRARDLNGPAPSTRPTDEKSVNQAGEGLVPVREADRRLASLDIDLPRTGVEYMFTTPSGKIELSARSISKPIVKRGKRLGLVLLFLAGGWIIYKLVSLIGGRLLVQRHGPTLLIVAGVLSMLVWVFPVAGLLLVLTGIVFILKRRRERFESAAPAGSAVQLT